MTLPTYNPNVPQIEDTIDDGQPAFLTNFETIFSAFNANHVDLNDPTNPGNHSIIQLIQQMVSRATESQEIAIYSKKVADQTEQVFMRYPLNGKEFQLSQFQLFGIPKLDNVPFSNFSFLPGGIVVYFGFVQPNIDGFTIPLIPAICTNIMGVNLCPVGVSTVDNPLYQSNVAGLITTPEGKYSGLIINNSSTIAIPPQQYYLIFGNI